MQLHLHFNEGLDGVLVQVGHRDAGSELQEGGQQNIIQNCTGLLQTAAALQMLTVA